MMLHSRHSRKQMKKTGRSEAINMRSCGGDGTGTRLTGHSEHGNHDVTLREAEVMLKRKGD